MSPWSEPHISWLQRRVFACVLVVFALKAPLGPGRVAATADLAAALSLGAEAPPAAPGLTVLGHAAMLLPLGDIATRANFATTLCGALAAAIMIRLIRDLLPFVQSLAPARTGKATLLAEPLAAVAGAGLAALTFSFVDAATTFSAAAAGLPCLLWVWRALVVLLRKGDAAAAGCRAAFGCGLLATLDLRFLPFAVPPFALLWFLALRRGERWSLLAPLAAVLPLGLFVLPYLRPFATAIEPQLSAAVLRPDWLGELLPTLDGSSESARLGFVAALRGGAEQIGVLGAMLALVGASTLLIRHPFFGSLIVLTTFAGVLHAAQLSSPALATSAPFLLAICSVGLAAGIGIVQLAGKLGGARTPAALVLGVMALVWPFADGMIRKRPRPAPTRLMEAAYARAPLRARLDPGSPEMTGVLSLGRAIGLRPDVRIVRR